MVVPYTDAFKEQMVRRILGPPRVSPYVLAKEVGVSDAALYRWLKQFRNVVPDMNLDAMKARRSPRAWSAKEKLRVVGDAEKLAGDELGELLRREGVHLEQLAEWRRLVELALSESGERKLTAVEGKALSRRVKELERELNRKEKALAEGAAMLWLEKKLQTMGWDERHDHEDAEPSKRSER